MKNTILATIFIIIIFNAKQYFNAVCVCAIVYALFVIAEEIKELKEQLVEQQKDSERKISQTLSSIGLDLVQAIKEKL